MVLFLQYVGIRTTPTAFLDTLVDIILIGAAPTIIGMVTDDGIIFGICMNDHMNGEQVKARG
jgi:hypothetical protein